MLQETKRFQQHQQTDWLTVQCRAEPQALGKRQLGRQLLPTAALTSHSGSFLITEGTLHCKEEAHLWCENRGQGIAACRQKILPAIESSQPCWQ